MMAGNTRRGLGPVGTDGTRGVGEHGSVHAQVGQDHVVGAGKVQQALSIGLRDGPRVHCPVVSPSVRTSLAKLQIFPLLVPIVVGRPLSRVLGPDIRFARRGHLPGHNEADLQLVTGLQDRLIENPTVEADDEHHVGPTGLAHQGDHPAKPIHHGMARIAVLAPPAKDGVHHLPRPDHGQGLKAFHFFVGGRHPVPFGCLVVIQHHGIDSASIS